MRGRRRHRARPSHHDGEDDHEHDGFASIVVELPEITDIDALVASIGRLAREQNVLRTKGYLAVRGKPMRLLVQSVGERVRHQVRPAVGRNAATIGNWVVIGEQAISMRLRLKPDLAFERPGPEV